VPADAGALRSSAPSAVGFGELPNLVPRLRLGTHLLEALPPATSPEPGNRVEGVTALKSNTPSIPALASIT